MNVKRITGIAGSVGKSGLETILGVKPEQLEPLAQAVKRLDECGQLFDRKTQIRQEVDKAKKLTGENASDLLKTTVTHPIVSGFKQAVQIIKTSLHTYIDDVKLQLMINKERRAEKTLLLKKLHAELKDITRIEKANTRYERKQAKARAKEHKEGQDYYTNLTREVDGYLTANDNERIERANRIHGFFKGRKLAKKHDKLQLKYDGLKPEVDEFLTSKDNLRIGRENFLHTVPEIPQRVATHSQLQDKYEALKPEVDTFLQNTDNERITRAHQANESFEGGEKAKEHTEIQNYFDGIGEVFEQMERTFVDRDNAKIAEANTRFKLANNDVETAEHAIGQEGYDGFGKLLDGFTSR